VVAEVQLSVRQQAQRYEPIGVIGTVIMVIGEGTIFIIGATVVAGSALQAEDHTRYQAGIATELAELPFVASRSIPIERGIEASRLRY